MKLFNYSRTTVSLLWNIDISTKHCISVALFQLGVLFTTMDDHYSDLSFESHRTPYCTILIASRRDTNECNECSPRR